MYDPAAAFRLFSKTAFQCLSLRLTLISTEAVFNIYLITHIWEIMSFPNYSLDCIIVVVSNFFLGKSQTVQ